MFGFFPFPPFRPPWKSRVVSATSDNLSCRNCLPWFCFVATAQRHPPRTFVQSLTQSGLLHHLPRRNHNALPYLHPPRIQSGIGGQQRFQFHIVAAGDRGWRITRQHPMRTRGSQRCDGPGGLCYRPARLNPCCGTGGRIRQRNTPGKLTR